MGKSMAVVELVGSGSPTTADTQKRKQLEPANLDPDNAAQKNGGGGAAVSEPKRPRLESNHDPDGQVPQDGCQEDEKEDAMKGKESKHSKDGNGQLVDGQELVKEQLETITEEPASDVHANPDIGTAEELRSKNLEGKEGPRKQDVPVPTGWCSHWKGGG